uniref:Uncharacterized protein n=1 Tax=Triticum urartu TaxID=4572 RepID=A0A8R7UUI1_TRIUA
ASLLRAPRSCRSEGSRRYPRVRATRPPRVQEWEAPDPGQRRRAIPRALTNGSSRGALHSGPICPSPSLVWGGQKGGRSTGELGIGDELLRRQLLQFSYTDRGGALNSKTMSKQRFRGFVYMP